MFSSFYDCTREAKIGRNKHYLQLLISRKSKANRRQEDRVSIPVPFENIDGVAVLSGTNQFEEMMQAYADRIALQASVVDLNSEIERRTEAYMKKEEELNALPEIEEEEPEEEEPEVEEPVAAAQEPEVQGMAMETEDTADLPQVEDAEAVAQEENEKEKAKQQQKLERKQERERKRIEREQQIAKRDRLVASVEKLAVRVEEAQQTLTEEQEKLIAISDNFGEQLRLFEDGTEGAEEVFLEELKDGMGEIVDEEAEAVNEVEMAEPAGGESEQLLPSAEGVEEVQTEVADELPVQDEAASEQTIQTEGQTEYPEITDLTNEDGVPEVIVVEPEKITEKPVRIILTLKKPLDKFYASNARTDICDKEVIENTSMIIMEYGSKKSFEEHLKILNEVLEGPWKDIRRKPAKLLNTPYSTEKTMQYLLKTHKRKEISDTTIEKCTLCDNSLRRMVMEKHLKQYCMQREEACKYCEDVLIFKDMKEHHQGDCPRYLVSCPQRCFERNLERCKIEEHLKTCVNTVVDCRFKPYGCKVKVKRKQVRNHMYDDVAGHLDHLEGRMQLLTNYLLQQDPNFEEVIKPPAPEPVEEKEEMQEDAGDQQPAEVEVAP